MVTRTISVDVDVEMGDFTNDDILEEAESRGLIGTKGSDLGRQREAMLRALWDHDQAKVIELLKTYLCDVLGRAAI